MSLIVRSMAIVAKVSKLARIAVGVLLTCLCWGDTLVVDQSGGGDFSDIQSAIDAAQDGDTVLVMPGTYAISEPIRFNRFYDLNDPQFPPKNIVVTSAEGPQKTIIMGTEALGFAIFIMNKGESPDTVLQGFTLTRGETRHHVTGIEGKRSSATIIDCIFTKLRDGAVFFYGYCSIRFINCEFSENEFLEGPIEISGGAGLRVKGAEVSLINCVFRANKGYTSSAFFGSDCRVFAKNCLFYENGPISPTARCAAIYLQGHSRGSFGYFQNCTIAGNLPANRVFFGLEGTLSGVSITARLSVVDAVFENCIIWEDEDVTFLGNMSCGSVRFLHSCINPKKIYIGEEAEVSFEGCINEDPLFVDPDSGDFRLSPLSPAIDMGWDADPPRDDLAGNQRPCWGGIDIGAYEYCREQPPEPLEQFFRGDANDDGTRNLADAIYSFGYVFGGGSEPRCLDAADANDDGRINIADAVAILSYLFGGTWPLPLLPVQCTVDSTVDSLDCRFFENCGEFIEWRLPPLPEITKRFEDD